MNDPQPPGVPAAPPANATLAAAGNPVASSAATPRLPAPGDDVGTALTLSADALAGAPGWDVSRLPMIEPGSYRITCEVAQGGIGRILMASDTRLHRPVAIKELLADAGPAAEERFVREALLTARLQHPSIVPLYEAGRWPSGAPFYAMKLVSGRSLAEVIAESRTLEQRLGLLPHVLAAAEAMAYAHSERIIHRDLKPANVLVGAFGETVVIDWGLAKDLAQPETEGDGGRGPAPVVPADAAPRGPGRTPPAPALTIHGAVMGTPAYMPPEQAGGERVDERADVYALGAILYHLLAGTCPYEGETAMRILLQVMAGPPPPLGELVPGLAEDLLTIVGKAMARDPADRYPSARELAEDLRRFQTGQIVGAHSYSWRELLRRFARRYRAALAVAGAAALVLAITSALAMRRIMAGSSLARERQATAEQAERRAVERADDLTLVQARDAVERDPNQALAWLKTLSPSFRRWPEARLIAADARARGVSTVMRGHAAGLNEVIFSPDGKLLATTSDDSAVRVWTLGGSAPAGRLFAGHTDEAWAAAFSPDSALLATGGQDKTLRIWDVKTGTSRVLAGQTRGIPEVFFAGQELVVTSSDDGTVRLWDARGGAPGVVLGPPGTTRTVTVSADGRRLAGGGLDGVLRIWDLEGRELRRLPGHEVSINGVAFSPDGKTLATRSDDGMVRRWDVESGASRILSPRVAGSTLVASPFGKLHISPDGSMLAASGEGPFVRLWDLASGAERRLEGVEGQTSRVAFSPDSKRVAAGSYDHTVRVWDLAQGGSRAFRGFEDMVFAVAFSPDGKLLAAASGDHTARLFPVATTASRSLGDQRTRLLGVEISPDGSRVLAIGEDATVRVWDLASGALTLLEGHEGPVSSARFSPDGALIASTGRDRTTRLWDLSGQAIRIVRGAASGAPSPASPPAFSSDGHLVASSDGQAGVTLLDVDSGATRRLEGHEGRVISVVFSPDDARLASTSADKTIRIWDLATGASRVLRGHDHVVYTAAFSPDGKTLASGSADHTLRFWDLTTGESRRVEAGGGGVLQITFSADGATAITGDAFDTGVRLWDVATGARRAFLSGHAGFVVRYALSPDQRRLVTASADKTVRVWDLASGESQILRGHTGEVFDVAFSPDGKLIASASADGTVRLWPDDLPDDPAALRAWLEAATPDAISARRLPEPAASPASAPRP